eukprot:scaffold111510_cov54-Attheya_sp.AAC.3
MNWMSDTKSYPGIFSVKEAIQQSLLPNTKSGKRLTRLIRKGADIITNICEHSSLPKCVMSFDDFLDKSPQWNSHESSTTIFNQVHPDGGQVLPFLRLQTEGSDLCYLIQSSNALYYHLTLRKVRGEEQIRPFNLNNARHIRDIYTNELSCKHVFIGFGGNTLKTIKDILRMSNSNVCDEHHMVETHFSKYSTAEGLFHSLQAMIKSGGPGIVDIQIFDEFTTKDHTPKFTGAFSSKASEKYKGKHTLLLVGVRRSTEDESPNEGGYFGLFQNTWSNRPIWVEIGFDLLQSMECEFHFISNKLSFDKEFESPSDYALSDIQSMSSLPLPPSVSITICERTGGTARGMGENNEENDDSKSEGDLGSSDSIIADAGHRTMDYSRYFNFDVPNDGMIYVIE